jgi:hypothetical protein
MPRAPVAAWLCAVALSLGGCGGAGAPSPARRPETRQARALAEAAATHEYPSPPAPSQRAPGQRSAVGAITAFARRYINWTAQDVSPQLSQLARASIGQARTEMALAAAETRTDSTLRQGGIANRGSVEAVAPLAGSSEQYVVVTREATTASATSAYQGLAPAWHVTLATVTELGPPAERRWVLSAWQPQN